ncbi:hypothetical protein BKA63DRAFT_604409 [Paraphoma chrysanthemicola]|nr:hypothetical protein BKA63DRAFT_604409 [Paraphoma chrysanthemicola]
MSSPEVTEEVRLQRAAFTLQSAFAIFREVTWHNHIYSIKLEPRQIAIKEDPNKLFRFQGWFSPYPVPMTPKHQDKVAVLMTMGGDDVGHMRELIEQMVESMDVKLEDILIRPRPTTRRTVILRPDATIVLNDNDHWLIRITLNTTGEQYALDISGAQYNHHTYLSPWSSACDTFIAKILLVKPFGTLQKYVRDISDLKDLAGLEAEVQADAMASFHGIVDIAMQNKNLTWSAILSKPEKDYIRHRDKVLRKGKHAMEEYVQATHLAKRRLKAERYERRNPDFVVEGLGRIQDEVLGLRPTRVKKVINGVSWWVSGKVEPEVD